MHQHPPIQPIRQDGAGGDYRQTLQIVNVHSQSDANADGRMHQHPPIQPIGPARQLDERDMLPETRRFLLASEHSNDKNEPGSER